ncbi:hypothetical protein [Myxococcus faecalis]|uniref:hypothetical protein n=1 Tax=Myxococcus faecalis TaxID=3115646 RepID=UPI003CF2D9B6
MHPPRAPQLPKSVLLAGVALFLGLLAWSPPARAERDGALAYATFKHHGTEPKFEVLCKYTYPLDCNCKWGGRVPTFDSVMGCSKVSYEDAVDSAHFACRQLCNPVDRFPGETGVTIARFPASGNQGVTLQGAGTIFQTRPGLYLGVPAFGGETVGPFHELEYVGEQLTLSTGAAWNWLVPGSEPIIWSDPYSTAAFVQSFRVSDGGPPPPVGECFHSLERVCEFDEPLVWGDRLRICSNEGEYDAWVVGETACAQLRHEAWFQSLQPWGIYSSSHAENVSKPAASIIISTPDGAFLGFLPGTSSPSRIDWEWQRLADQLAHETQGASVWLVGDMELYESQP